MYLSREDALYKLPELGALGALGALGVLGRDELDGLGKVGEGAVRFLPNNERSMVFV